MLGRLIRLSEPTEAHSRIDVAALGCSTYITALAGKLGTVHMMLHYFQKLLYCQNILDFLF